MTAEELLGAINASGLTAQTLGTVLGAAGLLVQREQIRAQIAKKRLEAQAAAQAFEAEIQALEAAFQAADAALQQ
jgi:CO/xanthine dehydrogenase Mo-binding subunit